MSSGQDYARRQPLRVGACLSLTGQYSRFGTQAAKGLKAWQSLDGAAELVIEDDESSPRQLERMLPQVARRCDVLLGPYSTQLMRRAGRIAAGSGWLLWNHGGSGDDVETAHPGYVASVLTPASKYADPFLRHMTADYQGMGLRIACGRGSFGKQVAAGAEAAARRSGIEVTRVSHGDMSLGGFPPSRWGLLCTGTFEEDVETVRWAQALSNPPDAICAVAAGVREFSEAVPDAEGVFGMGQWFPRAGNASDLGPDESAFLAAFATLSTAVPDYPAVQAAAGAVLAVHCARLTRDTSRVSLWRTAADLDTRTLFGRFKISPGGVQVGHEVVLIRWTASGPMPV